VRIEHTQIEGVAILYWDMMRDERGGFARTFCEEEMARAGLPFRVTQANVSRNQQSHTLRGLHLQRDPHGEPKIVSCSQGKIWDVAVDLRAGSSTYRRWYGFELAPGRECALHLPAGVAHGFLTLEPESVVQYLMGAPYVPEAATGVRWDDPALGIQWPAIPLMISERDRSYPPLDLKP
jgi:dTDP-4-dehydrorhamnose 3,5-epimerase